MRVMDRVAASESSCVSRATRSSASMARAVSASISSVVVACLLLSASAVTAQVESAERRCITTFTKSVRLVAKKHGKIVKKCLKKFSAGSLTVAPEVCIAEDPGSKLLAALQKGIDKTNAKCGTPASFGTTLIDTALTRAIVMGYDQIHGSISSDLDTGLILDKDSSKCQAKVYSSVLKCADARVKEYFKCQNSGLRDGTIVDSATLASTCLGSGLSEQPDPKGKIAKKCGAKLLRTIQKCKNTDLSQAFVPCGSTDAATVASCLSSETACQFCRVLNDVGDVVRDCDAFDDGDDTNGSCSAECSDGLVHPDESCDDGNSVPGDGCSDFCLVEGGWSCTGEPSVCTQNCGNGALDAGEACDDGGTAPGDGCSDTCTIESGYECSGEPSSCNLICSNGDLDAGEQCDDGNTGNGDGCSDACVVEPGFQCSGEPSSCTFVCGNGTFQAGEQCDDGDASGGDGCGALCQIETGWLCSGTPSFCQPICGDGLLRGPEGCDDGDAGSGDGCSFLCQPETGYSCGGEPSSCSAICGDGFIRGNENCDDSNTVSGDGCSGTLCKIEFTHECAGAPSVCIASCGDGNLDGIEECDDGGTSDFVCPFVRVNFDEPLCLAGKNRAVDVGEMLGVRVDGHTLLFRVALVQAHVGNFGCGIRTPWNCQCARLGTSLE